MASEGRNASSWAAVANTTALTPLSNSAGAASRSATAAGSRGSGASTGVASASGRVGRVDITVLDVGVDDGSAALLRFDIRGLTTAGGAGTTKNTGRGDVLGGRIGGIEPEHARGVVVPDGKSQNHSGIEGLTHLGHTTEGTEVVLVTESLLLLHTEVVSDGVAGVDSGDGDLGVLDDFAVLDVETTDLGEVTGAGPVRGNELGDDGEFLAGVDGLAFTEEGLVTHTEGVEVASVFVADTTVTIVAVTTLSAGASGLTVGAANVRGVCGSVGVGFPDIHLAAAGTVLAISRVGRGAVPSEDVSLERGENQINKTK